MNDPLSRLRALRDLGGPGGMAEMASMASMGDPMAMARGIEAMGVQAKAWIASTMAALEQAGLGFGDEAIRAEIAAQAAAHPMPDGYEAGHVTQADRDAMLDAGQRALAAVYPPNGIPPDDPRLAPIEGTTLATHAIVSRAIGWSTDEAFQARVARCVGMDFATYQRTSAAWSARVRDDIILGTMYGQLFSAA